MPVTFDWHPGRWAALVCVALGLLVLGQIMDAAWVWILGPALALLVLAAGLGLAALWQGFQFRRHKRALRSIWADDPSPNFLTDTRGVIWFSNPAADQQFGTPGSGRARRTLDQVLGDAASGLSRVCQRALSFGFARHEVETGKGAAAISVRRLGSAALLWRVEGGQNIRAHPCAAGEDPAAHPSAGQQDGQSHGRSVASRRDVHARSRARSRFGRIGASPPASDASPPSLPSRLPSQDHTVPARTSGGADTLVDESFDAMPVPMIQLDQQAVILHANRAARSMFGADLGPACRVVDVMEGLGRPIQDWIDDAFAKRGAVKSEFLRLTGGDRERFVQVTLNPGGTQTSERLTAILWDATELKTLEAQFVQSQKMQAIGQLAGGVAHDFNNLLTAISGHCDLMLLRHDNGDADYADLMQIHQNANRAAALVGQLLAFSRKQTLRPEVLDVRDTLSDLTHLLNRLVGERVRLTFRHDPVLGAIRADKRQLEQVLMNLVVNARDAMPDGGDIRIVTEAVSLTTPLVRDRVTLATGDYVSVKVIDNGTGIAPDKIDKVFEPFFTTKATGEGTGLGLSTAYGIVKQTGGYIFVDSAVGEGTCFTLIFPVRTMVDTPVNAALPELPKPTPKRGQGIVLLVEDEPPVRAFAARALRLRGYDVIEAESAEAALDKLQDADLHVDVFVTDVVMPGMDGPTWVKHALRSRPGVRVVFVSGYAETAFGASQPDIPNSVFLPKPFSLRELTDVVYDQMVRDPAE